ncbi:MAG: hypothetical protein MRJ96_14115 [Nitrospirales bacterium]|nr:hypothetical protein [Nitrospira sp.]MDR4502580.1 hypothetical protein [Nitrospirales bacterium]
MAEIVVPARLSRVTTVDPGEIRAIELTLPEQWEVEGKVYPVLDVMRPGNAFLTKPWGMRTEKWRRRMYTRSNTAVVSPHRLETIINFTHEERSDTSQWWQTDDILQWQKTGKTLDVRVDWNEDRTALRIYENSRRPHETNLYLESDHEWPQMSFFALAFSTGITPFLAYIRYMRHHNFGRSHVHPGVRLTLVVSVRHLQQLLAHDELEALADQFSDNFQYHPVLTRSWPNNWKYATGRVIQTVGSEKGDERVDLSRLLAIESKLSQRHIRFCGNTNARDQLKLGLTQHSIEPLSLRAEVW